MNESISEESKRIERLRREKTSKSVIKEREGYGGMIFKYVNRFTVMRWLDKNYPNLWSMEVDPSSLVLENGLYRAVVKLTVKELSYGIERAITCVGEEGEKNNNDQEGYKAAETDALKRCVFTLGGFSDIYAPDEFLLLEQTFITKEEFKSVIEHLNGKEKTLGLIKSLKDLLNGVIDYNKYCKINKLER